MCFVYKSPIKFSFVRRVNSMSLFENDFVNFMNTVFIFSNGTQKYALFDFYYHFN